jgi:hypothetical protein
VKIPLRIIFQQHFFLLSGTARERCCGAMDDAMWAPCARAKCMAKVTVFFLLKRDSLTRKDLQENIVSGFQK